MTSSPPQPRPRPATLALILGALTALGPLSIDMYLPSLPTIQRDLGTTASLTQLTLAAYFAGLGLGQLAYGPLTDRFGRKRPLYAGLTIYALASIACALSPSVEALIALRFLQAVGGAAGQVVTRAVVRDLYTGAPAAQLLSRLMLVMGVAPILAPLLGGWLLLFAGWRAIFALLAVLGLGCLALMLFVLPETAVKQVPRLEVAVIGRHLRELAGIDPSAPSRSPAPSRRRECSRTSRGRPSSSSSSFTSRRRPTGGSSAPTPSGLIAGSQINHRLLARWLPAQILARSTAWICAVGAVLVAVAVSGWGGLPAVVVSLFAFVASLGFVGSNAVALAMEEQGSRAGLASAALGATQFLVAACASSLVGVLNDGSARPMAAIMAACGLAAWIANKAAGRGEVVMNQASAEE